MMRKLYLVPILHMSADMGSLASALDETAKTELVRIPVKSATCSA